MQKKIKLKDISSILFIMYLFHLVFMIFFNNIIEIRDNKIFEYIYFGFDNPDIVKNIHLKYIDGYLVFR